MALSPEQLTELRELEPHYLARLEIRQPLMTMTTVKLIGPTGIGKNTLSRKITELKPEEFHEVGTVTDRPGKPNDPENYVTADDGITPEILYEEAMAGTLVNFAVNTNDHTYATRLASFQKRFNLFPLLPDSIGQIDRVGFARSPSVYLYASGEDYLKNLTQGGRLSYQDIKPRGQEALRSLEWAKANREQLIFVENAHGPHGLLMAAEKIIAIAYNYPIAQDEAAIDESLDEMFEIAYDLAK